MRVQRLTVIVAVLVQAYGHVAVAQQNGDRAGARQNDVVMRDARPAAVEKDDLAPVMAEDGSSLPLELWQGLDAAGVETLLKALDLPPKSPAIHSLWARLMTAGGTPAAGSASDRRLIALRLDALYRSGLVDDASTIISKLQPFTDPALAMLAARNELAAGHREKACDIGGGMAGLKGDLPPGLAGEPAVLSGICAMAANDPAGAGLSAELAREAGAAPSIALTALDDAAAGRRSSIPAGAKRISAVDLEAVSLAGGGGQMSALLDKAEPAALVRIASAEPTDALHIIAAETAAGFGAITADRLIEVYRKSAAATGNGADKTGPWQRAMLAARAEREGDAGKKLRMLQALALADGRGNGPARAAALLLSSMDPAAGHGSDIGETGAAIALAAGDAPLAKRWLAAGQSPLAALIAIADPASSRDAAGLAPLEAAALSGKFSAQTLQRLVAVLEALDYLVPIPLWDAANRAAPLSSGYLPPTGVLSQLQTASQKREFGHTVLLVMTSLGPGTADTANLLALGDSIRALKRSGLEPDARRLALEALWPGWPRPVLR